ncbi:hypothetical protein DI005_36945 [Prauserella sp. PE36]|nr:hypothetical protein BAY59_00770 [Prauserella coralliicola]RBM10197.1 hypothetical protein DI005_36945 [Prauserella sp. PE36]
MIAAALAAITAAFLGSSLGVYGTVLGAGVVSIVTTVGSEVYLRSLKTTKEATKKAKAMAAAITDARGWQTKVQQRTAVADQPTVPTTRMPVPGDERTRYLPKPDETKTVFLPKPGEGGDEPPAEERRAWWKRRWPLLVGTSVAAFVIGMFVVTGFELATGSSLSGNGRSTVNELVGNTSGQTEHREQQPGQQPSTEQQEPTGSTETTGENTPTQESTPGPTEEQQPPPAEPSPSSSSSEPTPTEEQLPLPGDLPGDQGGQGGGGLELTPEAVP